MTEAIIDPVILSTARLTLRPFDTSRHLTAQYVAWLNDPDVVRYSEQRHKVHTIESCRAFVEGFDQGPSRLWAIERRDDDTHIGNIHADIDTINSLADVAILIGNRYAWGHGFGLEAWDAVLGWLLNEYKVRKVVAGCMESNTAMLRIMQKSAMTPDGERKAHYLLDGQPEDIVFCAKFRTG
ncbi:MAG: GNAT family N-acetyltransferase [Rhodospirillales bacterium]|nr:GNAT family N-acetyltransferase [Rhodospirillales bacterium]